jgi:threonine dehydratase
MRSELLKDILKARVYDVARHTPLQEAGGLSKQWNNHILIKREDLQPIFSFKIRGAYNCLAQLSVEERARGVICASAGNHGQGLALAAKHFAIPAWVVMPMTTPEIKIKAVANWGAEVVLAGDHYAQAWDHAQILACTLGATMIHPFDDWRVIAGQGTVGKELVEDCPHMDYVFVPVGGGGLLAGIATYIKALYPQVRIIGVEPKDSDAMTRSIHQRERVSLQSVGIFADGVAVRQVGKLTYSIIQECVDDFVLVSTDEICSAIHDIYKETRSIVEPAGALSWAGAKAYLQEHELQDQTVITINSGANMNFQRLQFAAERALTGAGLEALFAIRLDERKGALKEFCKHIIVGKSITEFNYRCHDPREAFIFLGVATSGPAERPELGKLLQRLGYAFADLTDNELAKEHVRHMVGGRPHHLRHEALYSFVFPERPSALADFLAVMSERWNITLFHYRSHGADYGRVLIAFEVTEDEKEIFETHLRCVGYSFTCETHNLAYSLFLQNQQHAWQRSSTARYAPN